MEAGARFGVPDRESDPLDETVSENGILLAHVLPSKGFRFLYCYDFGDDWNHVIALEALL